MLRPRAKALRRAGFICQTWKYSSVFRPIDEHARRLHRRLLDLEDDPRVRTVHLVTHSLGGVVARAAIARGRPVQATKTAAGVRATIKGQPIDPEFVQSYVEQKFGEDFETAIRAMRSLAKAYTPKQLAEVAFPP